jgi:Ca2+-binding RTX toxin-like protein
MSNNVSGSAIRNIYGLSQAAPSSITTYSVASVGSVTDGTDGADTIRDITTSNTYIFGMGGNDTLYNTNSSGSMIGVILVGGTGNDIFVFDNITTHFPEAVEGNALDFQDGDRIDVSGLGITSMAGLTITGESDSSGTAYNISHSSGWNIALTGPDILSGGLNASHFIFSGGGNTSPTPTGTDANDTLTGTANAEAMYGYAGNDVITGLAGDDILYGNQGADSLTGNLGSDTLYGGQGADTILGMRDNDHIYGNMEADLLYGGYGSDTLYGGQGNDSLTGGPGSDYLLGGIGNDYFLFLSSDAGADIVADFTDGDRIQISSSLLSGGTLDGNLTSTANGTSVALIGGSIYVAGVVLDINDSGFEII